MTHDIGSSRVTIGDGHTHEFTINVPNAKSALIRIYETATKNEIMEDFQKTSGIISKREDDRLVLTFATAPATDEYTVTVNE